jgi:hypothetical protein
MPTPTPTPRPVESAALPFNHRTRPLPRLTAAEVAARIRACLAGQTTRAQLSEWAMAQFVKQDFSQWFDPAQARLLMESIATLIPVEEADAARERESLERLAHRLDTAA